MLNRIIRFSLQNRLLVLVASVLLLVAGTYRAIHAEVDDKAQIVPAEC